MISFATWIRWALLALLLAATASAPAQTPARLSDLRVLTGDNGPVTREIVQSLLRRYPTLQESSSPKAFAARKGSPIYLTIGPSALAAALNVELDGPIVSLFTSSQVYTDLVARAPRRPAVTAIYAEASPTQQMRLIARLSGRRVTVAVLTTDNTAYLRPLLRQAARAIGLDLELQPVQPDENVLRVLARISPSAVLLAVPDSALYTPESLRNILDSTYRRNQPVFGFSTALVKAGTIATAYSTIDDVIAQLDEVLDAATSGRILEPQYPRYWRVAINENVARSLNVVVNDDIRALGERPRGSQ